MATPISYFCNSNEMLSAVVVVPLIEVAACLFACCCNVLSCSFCSFWSEEYSTNLESSVQWEKTAGTPEYSLCGAVILDLVVVPSGLPVLWQSC